MATVKERVHRYNGSSYDTVHYETDTDLVQCSWIDKTLTQEITSIWDAFNGKADTSHTHSELTSIENRFDENGILKISNGGTGSTTGVKTLVFAPGALYGSITQANRDVQLGTMLTSDFMAELNSMVIFGFKIIITFNVTWGGNNDTITFSTTGSWLGALGLGGVVLQKGISTPVTWSTGLISSRNSNNNGWQIGTTAYSLYDSGTILYAKSAYQTGALNTGGSMSITFMIA